MKHHLRTITTLALAVLFFTSTHAAVVTMQPLTTFGPNGDGSLRPGDVAFLTSASQFQRGLAYNPTTGHLLVVDRSPSSPANNAVYILDGNNGQSLGQLDNSSTLAGGNAAFTLNLIGVADDGVIYVANLTSSTAGAPQTRLYRWENESAPETLVSPTATFPADDPSNGATDGFQKRWGDTMAVRGSGLNIQVLLANRGTLAAIYTPDDATFSHFTPRTLTTDVPAGALGYGLTFGAGSTFWGTAGANSGGPLLRLSFDTVAGTATTLKSYPSPGFPGTVTPILLMPASNLLAGITMVSGPDVVRLYDVSDVNTPVLLDRKGFSTNVNNGTFSGSLALGTNGVLYALDSDNGIMAFVLTNAASNDLSPAFFQNPANLLAIAGNNATLVSGADSSQAVSYQWLLFDTNAIAIGTNAILTFTNVQATDAGNYSVIASNALGSVTSSVAVLTVALAPPSTLIAYDPIPYAPGGNLAGQGKWFSTAGQDQTFKTESGNLEVPGLASPSGNLITWPLTPASSVRLTNGVTTASGPIYFSFAYRVDNLGSLPAGGAGSTVAAFVQNFTTASYTTKIDVRKDIDGVNYNVGVFKTTGETVGGWATNVLSLSNTVFIVGRYVYGDGAADDTCALWVNPDTATFGATNTPMPSVGDVGVGGVDFAAIVGFGLRTSGGPSRSYADEVRVGLTWADVTPPFVAAPTLAITPDGNGTVVIKWPTVATGFNLESATNLISPISWSAVTNAATVIGGTNNVTVGTTNAAQFFRLKK